MWRPDDHSIYAVDRSGSILRLLRWRYRASKFDVLAVWPTLFQTYHRFYLSGGPEGDIVLTATRLDAAKSLVARIAVHDKGGSTHVAGTKLPGQGTWGMTGLVRQRLDALGAGD
jgi:hypothetical protein